VDVKKPRLKSTTSKNEKRAEVQALFFYFAFGVIQDGVVIREPIAWYNSFFSTPFDWINWIGGPKITCNLRKLHIMPRDSRINAGTLERRFSPPASLRLTVASTFVGIAAVPGTFDKDTQDFSGF